MATKTSKWPRARQLWFCTNVYALNGKKILDLDECEQICQSKIKLIEKFAIGKHDLDKHDAESIKDRESHRKQLYMERYKAYAEEKGVAKSDASESGYVFDADCEKNAKADVDFYYPIKNIGDDKELHIHCFIQLKYARYIDQIANWFGIPVTMIDIKNGHHAFEDCAAYLVHAKQPEKYDYRDVISSHIRANFNYQEWLENQAVLDILHEKYHMNVDDIYDIVNKVANEGLNLLDVEGMISTPIFLKHKKLFRDARDHYIYNTMEMPANRFVIYVDGNGQSGAGKSIATQALCKQFARDYGADITLDVGQLPQYIYKAGGKGVAWQRYDGQPIVYIDDREAIDLLMEFNGHDGVKNLFDPYPQKELVNIKYGDAIIVAKYIVINGIQPFDEFVDGLNGSYTTKDGTRVESDEDIVQYKRRIQAVVKLYTEDEIVELLFNSGIMKNTREYEKYESIKVTAMNFPRLIERFEGDARVQIETKTFDALIRETKAVEARAKGKISSIDAIPSEFAHYGEELDPLDNPRWLEGLERYEQDEIDKYVDRLLYKEYSEVFIPLWVSVNLEDIISGNKQQDVYATFEDWKAQGCCNAYDAEKNVFYRKPDSVLHE